jgi:hypothetical protein
MLPSDFRIYQLSDVFNEAKVPVLTFVPPKDFNDLVGSLKTPGKHVTLSGPSGSGKTTLAEKALEKAGIGTGGYYWISGRDYAQKELLIDVLSSAFGCDSTEAEALGYLKAAGILVIDDFHHLQKTVRDEIGLKLKRWGELGIRVFVVGIAGLNKALLDLDSELAIRNDTYEMGTQKNEFIESVIKLGEDALRFYFTPECKKRFISASLGVPSAIQLICRVACTRSDLSETCQPPPRHRCFYGRDKRCGA